MSQSPNPSDRQPRFIPSRTGRVISYGGLVERILTQFHEEHGDDILRMPAEDETERRTLVKEVGEYIFAVESVLLTRAEQAEILQRVYSELFGYGVLDALLHDPRLTTISIEGADKLAVREGPGQDLTPRDTVFDDVPHVRRTLEKILHAAGAELREDTPIIETGLTVNNRAVCLNVGAPPFTAEWTADIRLHPLQALTLDDLVNAEFMTPQAAALLRAIVTSVHGLVVVGNTEAGKTTLMSALVRELASCEGVTSVERAQGLHVPAEVNALVVKWPVGDKPGVTFAEQIQAALEIHPSLLVLDELRSDDRSAITPLLSQADAPRQWWVFRGTTDALRTRTALTMLARMSDPSQSEAQVDALTRRLPFIVMVKRRRQGGLELREIGEWQFREGRDYADYVPLMEADADGLGLTKHRPALSLDLPADFWG